LIEFNKILCNKIINREAIWQPLYRGRREEGGCKHLFYISKVFIKYSEGTLSCKIAIYTVTFSQHFVHLAAREGKASGEDTCILYSKTQTKIVEISRVSTQDHITVHSTYILKYEKALICGVWKDYLRLYG
jgi:hypothetical protein